MFCQRHPVYFYDVDIFSSSKFFLDNLTQCSPWQSLVFRIRCPRCRCRCPPGAGRPWGRWGSPPSVTSDQWSWDGTGKWRDVMITASLLSVGTLSVSNWFIGLKLACWQGGRKWLFIIIRLSSDRGLGAGGPSDLLSSFLSLVLSTSHLTTPDNVWPGAAPGHLAPKLRGLASLDLDPGGHGGDLRPLWKWKEDITTRNMTGNIIQLFWRGEHCAGVGVNTD